jgi:hypothetical protein
MRERVTLLSESRAHQGEEYIAIHMHIHDEYYYIYDGIKSLPIPFYYKSDIPNIIPSFSLLVCPNQGRNL